MLRSLWQKWFGTAQDRALKRYRFIVDRVVRWEQHYQTLSDEELRSKTHFFKERIQAGASLDSILAEAYAVVMNACRRLCGKEVRVSGCPQVWDMVPYEEQILGGIVLFHNAIAEMQTGEGKTLTVTMPLYLYALTGKAVHMVTVNEYLAKRDCEWTGSIFRWLGLTTGVLCSDAENRKEVYESDIVYGTVAEFAFDYLRDAMAMTSKEIVQRGLRYAFVDEIDSILIDESRTPLVISGPSSQEKNESYVKLKESVLTLVKQQERICQVWEPDLKEALSPWLNKGRDVKIQEWTQDHEKALRKIWVIYRGIPKHPLVKEILEHPDLRERFDIMESHFLLESNKEERAQLLSELYLIVHEPTHTYELTDRGISFWSGIEDKNSFTMFDLGEEYARIDNEVQDPEEREQEKLKVCAEDQKHKERFHALQQLLRACLLMERNVDYLVEDNKVIIIDPHTGRLQPERRFANGLHQAIEAIEGVDIQGETQTYATITIQNFFRLYEQISGMTGTAMTDAKEFKDIYGLDVYSIPTHLPCQRIDYSDRIFMTRREKMKSLLEEVHVMHGQGRPILLGTESVEESEEMSKALEMMNLPHTVLNARNHTREAEIVAQAGRRGAITVATDMAGRGTDIKLEEGVSEIGGLHVICTTRHQSRRRDRQYRGRCARCGDPGSSRFYISFEDNLMRLFAPPRISKLLQRFRPPEGEAIESRFMTRAIETAQKRVEQRNFSVRKHTLEYDDVLNYQRKEFYEFRREILMKQCSVLRCSEQMLEGFLDSLPLETESEQALCNQCMELFPVTLKWSGEQEGVFLRQFLYCHVMNALKEKILRQKQLFLKDRLEKVQESEAQNEIESAVDELFAGFTHHVILLTLDRAWREHLLHIDDLQEEVRLCSTGEPLVEFKRLSFELFDQFIKKIQQRTLEELFNFQVVTTPPQEPFQGETRPKPGPEPDSKPGSKPKKVKSGK